MDEKEEKTSLVSALAGHFNKSIYALNIGSVQGDQQLIDAIASVPENANFRFAKYRAGYRIRIRALTSPVDVL